MFRNVLFMIIVSNFGRIKCMESFIVGGSPAKIQYFGHSAFLTVGNFLCGSSLLNQNVLLTAAHCFEGINSHTKICATAGNSNKYQGAVRYGAKLAVHGDYNDDTVTNDIALLYVRKAFVMGPYIKRVVLMKSPPKSNVANVAGWGVIDERRLVNTDWLRFTEQKLWSRSECSTVLKSLPVGSICGGAKYSNNYAAVGDSGSALIANDYIQVGVVSFKRPDITKALVVYTDVSFFYDWIKTNAVKLACHNSSVKPSTCGSSLITTKAVVTSAHCMREMKADKGGIHAYLGSSVPMYAKVVRNITSYRTHPRYNPTKGTFDLAVAKFDREVPIGRGIHKIPISTSPLVDNDALFTAGWGKQWPRILPDYSDMRHLEITKQRLLSVAECLENTGFKVSPAHVCTLPLNGYHYQGDMGNGLVTTKPWMALVGVVSFMVRGVTLYASLLNQRHWLRETLEALYRKEPLDKDCC